MTPGARVRALREAQGLSLSDLGRMSGTSKAWLSTWERGDRQIAASLLYNIARALGTTMDALMDGAPVRARPRQVRNAALKVWLRGDRVVQVRLDVGTLDSVIASATAALREAWDDEEQEEC